MHRVWANVCTHFNYRHSQLSLFSTCTYIYFFLLISFCFVSFSFDVALPDSHPLCNSDVSLHDAFASRCPFGWPIVQIAQKFAVIVAIDHFSVILLTWVPHCFFFLLQLTFILNLTHWINKFQCNFCGTTVDWWRAKQKLYKRNVVHIWCDETIMFFCLWYSSCLLLLKLWYRLIAIIP